MIPAWLTVPEQTVPPRDGGTFVLRSLRSLGAVLSRLKVQRGQDGRGSIPAVWKLLLLFGMLVLLSAARNRILLLVVAALVLGRLALLPGPEIRDVLKSAMAAAVISLLLVLPAMLLRPTGRINNLILVGKVFLSVTMVNIFNHRTQWNRITAALRKLHIPGVFVFLLDLTLKYIVLLGSLMTELLTALQLRSVGRTRNKYRVVGGVLGQTFLRSTELSRETWEAMCCRCFTDDYKGL